MSIGLEGLPVDACIGTCATLREQMETLSDWVSERREAEVSIAARDDLGDAAPGGDITFTLSAGEARDVSVQALENGADGFDGRFGDGEGKWRLTVSADRILHVLSLVRSPRGYLASLSQ